MGEVARREPEQPISFTPTGIVEVDELSESIELLGSEVASAASRLSQILKLSDRSIAAFECNLASSTATYTDGFFDAMGLVLPPGTGEQGAAREGSLGGALPLTAMAQQAQDPAAAITEGAPQEADAQPSESAEPSVQPSAQASEEQPAPEASETADPSGEPSEEPAAEETAGPAAQSTEPAEPEPSAEISAEPSAQPQANVLAAPAPRHGASAMYLPEKRK